MEETKKNIYSQYLSDLGEFERTLNNQNIEEFSKWREEVINSLDPRQRIRFQKIRFFEVTEHEDIPF